MATLVKTGNGSGQITTRKLWWAAPAAGAAAFIGNLTILFLAQTLFGLSPMVPQSSDSTVLAPLSAGFLLVGSIVPAIGAGVLLAILARFVKRPLRVFQIIAAVVLLLSFGGPLSLPIGGAEKVALAAMHVITAAAIVGVFTRFGREQQ